MELEFTHVDARILKTMNPHSPFFSIIIPTYNRAHTLGGAIQSILNQEESNFEVIIIDDGSTDNTKSVVEAFLTDKRLRYFYQENQERAAARNAGADLAKGKYLNFFDSDDEMYKHNLSTAYEFVSKNSDVFFFHTQYDVCNEEGDVVNKELGVHMEQAAARLIVTNYLGCNSVFVERNFFLINRFNPDRRLASSEDWELWLRLISRKPLYRCEVITLKMLNHGGRSLFTITPDRIIERDTVMLNYLLADNPFITKFRNVLKIFEADRYTFFALVLSVTKERRSETLRYLLKSLRATPKVLFRKRFWASGRHFIVSLITFPRS